MCRTLRGGRAEAITTCTARRGRQQSASTVRRLTRLSRSSSVPSRSTATSRIEVEGSFCLRMRARETSWRDQEQRKFVEAFEQTAKVLSGFVEASHQHVQFLGKKASLIEEYLKQR